MGLDYDLDLKVSFNAETEFKSLYSWCLKEENEKGQQVGSDLIPFRWSVLFISNTFGISETVSSEANYRLRSEEELKPLQFSKRTNIFAKLRTGSPFDHGWRYSPSISMIGSTRQVKEITLGIYRVETGSEESCVVWGSPAYSYENDFRDEKTEDVLTISFYLRSENFDSLYDLVRRNQLDWISLRLTDVEGFYSEWSPSISTHFIKVLANIADQRLELDEEWSKKIPTLGKVGQASLTFQRTLHSQNIPCKAEEDFGEISEENGAYAEVSADLERKTVADRASVEDSRYKFLERSLSRISKLLGILILVEILRAIF